MDYLKNYTEKKERKKYHPLVVCLDRFTAIRHHVFISYLLPLLILPQVKRKYVICRLGGPYSEKLWSRSWKCCPRPQAEGSIFKSEVTVSDPKPVNNFFFSKLSNEKKKHRKKTHASVTVTVVRDRKIRNLVPRVLSLPTWFRLVTCLLDFSRFQRCDSREGLES